MSDEWRHPTLADTGVTGLVRCPGADGCPCGRERRAEDMYDVRTIGVGQAHLCSACVEDLFRLGITDQLTFHRRAGAPADWLTSYEDILFEGPLLRPGLPQHIWGEILATELDRAVELAATEAAAAAPPISPDPVA